MRRFWGHDCKISKTEASANGRENIPHCPLKAVQGRLENTTIDLHERPPRATRPFVVSAQFRAVFARQSPRLRLSSSASAFSQFHPFTIEIGWYDYHHMTLITVEIGYCDYFPLVPW